MIPQKVVSFAAFGRNFDFGKTENSLESVRVSLSISVAFNSLLSFTSVNLIGFEFTFIAVIFRLAQPQVEPWTSLF